MTALGALCGDIEFLYYRNFGHTRESVMSYDGVNNVYIDWYEPQSKGVKLQMANSSDPVVVLVHGLGGSTEEAYIKKMALLCHAQGWRACSYDYWRFDFGEWRDLDIIVNYIAKQNPNAPIMGIAFSAGTHILLRYLQETGNSTPMHAAVCHSAVVDLMTEYKLVKHERSVGLIHFSSLYFHPQT